MLKSVNVPHLNYHPRPLTQSDFTKSPLGPVTLVQWLAYFAFGTLVLSLFLYSITWFWIVTR